MAPVTDVAVSWEGLPPEVRLVIWTFSTWGSPITWAMRAWLTVAVQDTFPLPTLTPATTSLSDHGSLHAAQVRQGAAPHVTHVHRRARPSAE